MSVITSYVRLHDHALETLRHDPHWLQSLSRKRVVDAELIDIDKAADGLVWLLSRVSSPGLPPVGGAGFVIQRNAAHFLTGETGTQESSLEAGYGPARLLSPSSVAELVAWLDGVTIEELSGLYDPKSLARAHVYPQIWMQQGRAAFDDYLVPHFQRLRAFLRTAASERQAVLVFAA